MPNKHPGTRNESWAKAQPQVQVDDGRTIISIGSDDDVDLAGALQCIDGVQGSEPERQQQSGREVAKNRQKVKTFDYNRKVDKILKQTFLNFIENPE